MHYSSDNEEMINTGNPVNYNRSSVDAYDNDELTDTENLVWFGFMAHQSIIEGY